VAETKPLKDMPPIVWPNLEAEKALYSQGQYTLDDKYSDLKVEYKVWKRMEANA
jgi:hypothetical protein